MQDTPQSRTQRSTAEARVLPAPTHDQQIRARCPVHSYHRDGAMRVDDNYGGTLGYEPNSYGEWQEQPAFREPPLTLDGAADHWNHREDDDDYHSQPAPCSG